MVPAGYQLYFNPDAFAVPVLTVPRVGGTPGQTVNVANPYYYGNAPRLFNNIRAPGIENWDLNVSRIIMLKERLRLEVRRMPITLSIACKLARRGAASEVPN